VDVMYDMLVRVYGLLSRPLFTLGDTEFTVWTLLYLGGLLVLLFFLAGTLSRWFAESVLAKRGIEVGVRQAMGAILRYGVLFIGFLVVVQAAGIDLSTLTILAGALGIGIGFGLQNITNNFVSGLIILFERPIKVGDRIEVGDVRGDVVRISMRATTVMTNDNIAVIVPNSEFISSTVVNWSYTDRRVRFNFPVGVSYRSDPEVVRELLLEIASDHPGVLQNFPPDVQFQEFGESSLNFVLRVWTQEYSARPGVLRSEINYAISKKFREHGIEIPFPQRDLHIRSGSVALTSPRPGEDERNSVAS